MERFLNPDPPSAPEIEKALLDFGFYHHFHEVSLMYSNLTNHNLLGYAGGVMDQPEEYWHDMAIMNWLSLWVKHIGSKPRMAPVSVFDTLRNTGRLDGKLLWQTNKSE